MLQMAVELVISPESIDVTVEDIGGLDEILNRLVRLVVDLQLILLFTAFCPCTKSLLHIEFRCQLHLKRMLQQIFLFNILLCVIS